MLLRSFKKCLFTQRKRLVLPDGIDVSGIQFTSDQHFFHANIILKGYCPGRKFRTVEEMNEAIVKAYNERVGGSDTVIFLGDYFWRGRGGHPGIVGQPNVGERFREMCRYTERLNGRKYLIRGNHDKFNDQQYIEAGFLGVGEIATLHSSDGEIVLIHNPVDVADAYAVSVGNETRLPSRSSEIDGDETFAKIARLIQGRYLCGHVHQLWRKCGNFVNVGIDAWDGNPVRFGDAVREFDDDDRNFREER